MSAHDISECDESPRCEHERPEYHRAYRQTQYEPGEPEGWYCPDCDEWLEEWEWPSDPRDEYDPREDRD